MSWADIRCNGLLLSALRAAIIEFWDPNYLILSGASDPPNPALKAMQTYLWPGNVRELPNVMERAVILAQDLVRRGNLPEDLLRTTVPESGKSRDVLKTVEREMIVKALRKHEGNRRLAATELGISRRTLQYKLKEFGLLDDNWGGAKPFSVGAILCT